MSIKERRARQKQQLRDGILSAAREIAQDEGWQAVTIRKIAGIVEYSPPVIYEYFDSKEDLLLELVRMGYAGQLKDVQKARESCEDPEDALLAMSRAWWRSAIEDPDLYEVMYGLGGVSLPVAELKKEGEKIAGVMAEVIGQVLIKNGKEAEGLWDKVILAWATLHGLASLALENRISGGDEAERLVDQAAHDFLKAWKDT